MEIVLTKDVTNLGHKGEVKTVKNGYFRNFLAPRGKAIRLTPKLMKQLEGEREQMEKRRTEMVEKAGEFAKKVQTLTLTFARKATAKGKLYAAITEQQVQRELEKHLKFELDKGCIHGEEAIKSIGEYTMTVKLTENTSAQFKVIVEAAQK